MAIVSPKSMLALLAAVIAALFLLTLAESPHFSTTMAALAENVFFTSRETHADVIHGADAAQARNTCEQHGIKGVFVQRPDFRVHFLCTDPYTNTSYTWLAEWNRLLGEWEEVTAYKPLSGEYSKIVEYLKATNKIPGKGGAHMNPGQLWEYLVKNAPKGFIGR
jgi:hypothetical protein